jgi:hypothetical protein
MLTLSSHGSTAVAVLAAAEALLLAASVEGAIVLGDDFCDGLDAATAEHFAAVLRAQAAQVWLTTRWPEVMRAFARVGIRTASRRRSRRGPGAPDHFGVQAGGGKPPDLVVYTVGLVVHAVDWCDDVGRIVGYHDIAEHEPSARPEPGSDAGEQVRLTCTVEVVHGEHRHDEVEVALGQWVLETAHAQIGRGDLCGCGSDHPRTLVDSDELRLWAEVEHPPGRLPRADAELDTRPVWIPTVASATAS